MPSFVRIVLRFWLMLLGFLVQADARAEVYPAVATWISDGDTLWVQPKGGGAPRKLRLLGIDAPEICQAGGPASRDSLRQLVQGQTLRVEVKYLDDYGRALARVHVAEVDVAAELVLRGQAWSARWHRSPGPYARQEAQARLEKRGLFAQPGAQQPRDFRRQHGSCYASPAEGASAPP